uniref:Uncharacterized protein n=1 Tax=Acrobeloides nanus TaxID=290746 RepID=A0A914E2Q8_9BILA
MPGISQIGFGINGNYTTSPESIGKLIFYKGNVLDKSTNGYYFDGWSNGWSNQCTPGDFYEYELEFKRTTCCINTASINLPEQTPQQTCRRFNATIDWFTKDGIVFNELRANISAGFDDPDNKDTLTVISSKNYQILYDDQMDINLFIDGVLIDLSSDQEGLSAAPNIGHFVFIDAYIIVKKLNTSDLHLATTSSISIYKHSSVYYNDDGSPFSEESPCATRDVEVFSNNPYSDEYAGMTSKSRICCTDWQPIAQNFTATPSKKPPKSYTWLIILYIFISILIMSEKSEKFTVKEDPTTSESLKNEESLEIPPEKRPFEDPINRTKILIQYIRLKQKRARAEMEQKTAMKQKKRDAQEKLQNDKEQLKEIEDEIKKIEAKKNELTIYRHELINQSKVVLQKESELKKRREEDEKRRREEMEMQRRQQAQQLEQAQQQIIQQQLLAQLMAQRAHATPSPLASHRASPYPMLPQQFHPPQQTMSSSPSLSRLSVPSSAQIPAAPMLDANSLLFTALFNQMNGAIRHGFPNIPGVPTTEQKR